MRNSTDGSTDSSVSEFIITARDFQVRTGGGNGTAPFKVTDGVVELQDTQVKGNLNVGVGQTGARTEITDDGIKIYDGNGLRVKIGLL